MKTKNQKLYDSRYYKKNKDVINKRTKAWLKANPEKFKRSLRKAYLKAKYNLTLEDYACMSKEQENRCAICGKVCKKLVVDHNHITKQVRGLLCSSCNSALGLFKEDLIVLQKAIDYLKRLSDNV